MYNRKLPLCSKDVSNGTFPRFLLRFALAILQLRIYKLCNVHKRQIMVDKDGVHFVFVHVNSMM